MTYYRTSNGLILQSDRSSLWNTDYEKLSNAEGKRLHREQCLSYLLPYLANRMTVYTTIRSVARSGMSRTLSVLVVRDGEIQDISYYVGIVCGYALTRDNHVKVHGCGFDAGHSVVYDIERITKIKLKQAWI